MLARYQKLARVPGFRKGKVPASIISQRFAKEIKEEIVEALVPRYFREETKKQNLQPVSQPRVTDLQLQKGEPLTFKANFEILPEFKDADKSSRRSHDVGRAGWDLSLLRGWAGLEDLPRDGPRAHAARLQSAASRLDWRGGPAARRISGSRRQATVCRRFAALYGRRWPKCRCGRASLWARQKPRAR